MMGLLNSFCNRLSAWMEIVAGISLVGVMLLIGADIVGRIFGHPVPGTYEIVSLAGGLIVGLALPATSRAKGHVSTDFMLEKLSARSRLVLAIVTRIIGILIFLLAGWGMVMMGVRLRQSGEVTAVLAFPFYYAAYAIAGAFFIQTLVLFSEIMREMKPESQRRIQV
ncbi:MAG: TRAP-type C4-dicarboxylate transport system, small permease component [Acidobacteria bacterium]|jgi:TRAP-type C4-dicarboxylate transport system permease small subunit|nr:TRAP-type C4-dicarboxylate transport system, small permease component [Acidobacteriota bacterium]